LFLKVIGVFGDIYVVKKLFHSEKVLKNGLINTGNTWS